MLAYFAFLLLFSSAGSNVQLSPEIKPGPEAFTANIHVQSSQLKEKCTSLAGGGSSCYWVQQLKVLIDGKKYILVGGFGLMQTPSLLRTGDYKARIVKEDTARPYEYRRTYEFLFSDDRRRKYEVTGESE
jgi:hypothetical protein